MTPGRLYSYLLVFLQFVLIFVFVIYTFFTNLGLIQTIFIVLGIALGFWAIFVMRKSKLRITPQVAPDAKLIKKGPYRFVRHPMYLAILFTCLGLLLTNVYSVTIFFYVCLFLVLNLKIIYEEKFLRVAFSNYKAYAKKTKKLIPFIY